MNQNEDLVVALMNLISLEKCVADNDVLLDMVRTVKDRLLKKSNEVDLMKIEEAEALLHIAEESLTQGDTDIAYASFGDVYTKICTKM